MAEQDDIKRLIANYQRRLQKLKERQALLGGFVDPAVRVEIENIEVQIERLLVELKEMEDSVESTPQLNTTTSSNIHGKSERLKEVRNLIARYQRRLQVLKEYRALSGISTDPQVVLEIEDAEAIIERLKAEWSDRILELKKLIIRHERDLLSLQTRKTLSGGNVSVQTLKEIDTIEVELERLRAELEQLEPQEGPTLISRLASRQLSLTPEITDQIIALSQSSMLSTRQGVLRAITNHYRQLPQPVQDLVEQFAADQEDDIRANLAAWIIRNYAEVGQAYEPVLQQLAQDESVIVRQTIINFGSLELERLPSRIRLLISQMIGVPYIKVEIIKGSGMLVGEPGELVLRVTNQNETGSDIAQIELLPSAEYKVLGPNPMMVAELKAGHSAEVTFQLEMKVAKQVVVNYSINGEMKEPPLYINVVKDNPYVYGDPIKEETAFYGRQKLLERIVQAVSKPTKQDILIVGERRTGKTSLIYQLQKRLDKPFIPVYVVLNTSEPNTEGVLKLILRKIVQSLTEREILENEWLQHRYPYQDFIDNLAEVIAAAKRKLADIRIILLLDEADFLLRIRPGLPMVRELAPFIEQDAPVDERPQNILRAALQSSEIGADLRAVVAGTTDLSTYVSQRSSPFFNHFRFEPLKPFTVQETRELITKPASALGYEYTQAAVDRISNLSGGQPYYCQALCYEAFESASQDKRTLINETDAAAAEKKITDDLFNSYLSGFWDRTTEVERVFLTALAHGKPRPTMTRAQIKRLLDWQLIVDTEGKYDFASGLIKNWTLLALQV